MNTLDAIRQRRAVKKFDPHHRMTPEEQRELLSLTLLSPTAFNIQHWRLVVVEDPALRRQLREVSWHQAQVTDASLLVALCADLKAWEKAPERYWRNADPQVREVILPAIQGYYAGNEQVQRDEGIRSASLAAQTLMLAAKGMGYDSCPMTGCDFAAVSRLLNLPPDHILVMMVAIGKPLEPARPRSGQLDYDAVVVKNRFP